MGQALCLCRRIKSTGQAFSNVAERRKPTQVPLDTDHDPDQRVENTPSNETTSKSPTTTPQHNSTTPQDTSAPLPDAEPIINQSPGDPHSKDDTESDAEEKLRVKLAPLVRQGLAEYRIYLKTRDVSNLDVAICADREALLVCPLHHPERGRCLNNLAVSLSDRSKETGKIDDLVEAIAVHREALRLRPPHHPQRDTSLNNLASALGDHFKTTGNSDSLAEAIRLHRELLQIYSPGHRNRHMTLNNLANRLRDRYNQSENVDDLLEAVQMYREALRLLPLDNSLRALFLNNLASGLWDRFHHNGNVDDLAGAIQAGREALQLRPPGHPDRGLCLSNLGSNLSAHFTVTDDPRSLADALQVSQEALELRPHGHPYRSSTLHQLANLLLKRYRQSGDKNDLVEAIKMLQNALHLCPRGHPDRSPALTSLAISYAEWLDFADSQSDPCVPVWSGPPEASGGFTPSPGMPTIGNIIDLLREATFSSPSLVSDRLTAAQGWRYFGDKYDHGSVLEAMTRTLDLLDETIAHARSVHNVYQRLSKNELVRASQWAASEAAALAIHFGDVRRGVTLLERGRAMIFHQLAQFRQVLKDLHEAVDPELVLRFTNLSNTLEGLVIRGTQMETEEDSSTNAAEDLGALYETTREAWTQTVDEIRKVDGFEAFLSPPSFEQLQRAAAHGPVIVININKRRSDAIIIFPSDEPITIPLPEATPEAVHTLADRLVKQDAQSQTPRATISILREIWHIMVEPVAIRLLGPSINLRRGSRIWWCATGSASRLPIHAVGPFIRGKDNLPDLFVSSSTPTLGALVRARERRTADSGSASAVKQSSKSILVVGQPDTPNEPPLLNVLTEVAAIQKCSPSATVLLSSQGTREVVLAGLQENAWLHLACHGHHEPSQPFRSRFSMHDGPITILDLIEKDLPHAELAVLSACHSARVCTSLPDEVLHPAASMMFAGYKSVVGTMWALDDALGSALAEKFYGLMFDEKDGPKDYSEAAGMLHKAFGALVQDGYKIPLMQRINVVHYGA